MPPSALMERFVGAPVAATLSPLPGGGLRPTAVRCHRLVSAPDRAPGKPRRRWPSNHLPLDFEARAVLMTCTAGGYSGGSLQADDRLLDRCRAAPPTRLRAGTWLTWDPWSLRSWSPSPCSWIWWRSSSFAPYGPGACLHRPRPLRQWAKRPRPRGPQKVHRPPAALPRGRSGARVWRSSPRGCWPACWAAVSCGPPICPRSICRWSSAAWHCLSSAWSLGWQQPTGASWGDGPAAWPAGLASGPLRS